MKSIIKAVSLLCIYLLCGELYAQQNGLAWFTSFGGTGVNYSPGFTTNDNGAIYLAINYTTPIFLTLTNKTDTLDPGTHGEAVVAQIRKESGIVESYFKLKSNAHISITDISTHNNQLVISGSGQDSVWMENSAGVMSFIGGVSPSKTGFQLFTDFSYQNIYFVQPVLNALQTSFERIFSHDSLFITTGKYLLDTLSLRQVLITQGKYENRQVFLPSFSSNLELTDITFAFGKLVFGGNFRDSISLSLGTEHAIAGKDALMLFVNNADMMEVETALFWKSKQNVLLRSMAYYNNSIWAGINFSDTLIFNDGTTLNSRSGMDAVLLRYDSLFQLQGYYQLKGNQNERIDKLYVTGEKLYVLANTSSDSCVLSINNNAVLDLSHNFGTGAHTLFSIDSMNHVNLVWMAKEGRLGKLTGVYKISPTETLLSGLFGSTITVDSVPYEPIGIQDVYMLRIDDLCLSRLKTTKESFRFCIGDSLQLIMAISKPGNILHPTGKSSDSFFISKPGKYSIPYISECGCVEADSLQFEWYKAQPGEKPLAMLQASIYPFRMANGNQIELRYIGECKQDYTTQEPQFSLSPNPSSTISNLAATLPEAGVLLIELVDGKGSVLWAKNHQTLSGSYQIPIDLQNLKAGNYFLRLNYDTDLKNSRFTLKITKL